MKSVVVFFLLTPCILADYWSDRDDILGNEAAELLGSKLHLTEDEEKVNDILMTFKLKEYDEGFADPSKFLPAFHFFHSKAAIEESEVFKLIKKLPKGASLHSHSSAMLSFDALFNLTYMEKLYGCDNNGSFQLQFLVKNVSDGCEWKLLKVWRSEDKSFDDFLRSKLTLVVDDPVESYHDINEVWSTFENIFHLVSPLFWYRPFLHDYLYQVFQEFYDDNVRYLEIRGSVGETFDENGTYNSSQNAQFYIDTLTEFKENHPDFIGLRIIYAKSRQTSNLTKEISAYQQIKEEFPEFIAGFDLVGQEDLGQPLSSFAEELLEIANDTDFYFHAGETNWYGSTTDLNVIDAILLGTKRIGHAFAITKHPEALRLVKEKYIAIELNPLSNQVLKLVDDLRNHVGANLIANGYDVVITCDDPSFWGAKGLSYDWYMAFMAMTPRDADLRVLKQLALNSLVYSSLSGKELSTSLALFDGWWFDFINETLATH